MITAAALILTGGRSTRFGSHKPAAVLAGRTLVGHVLHAVEAWPAVVVGSAEGVPPGIEVISEKPAGGGPVAAIAEGVRHLPTTEVVVLLAGDLPLVTDAHVARLVAAAAGTGLACFVDTDGRPQWLCAAWRADVLTTRLAAIGDPNGQSLRQLTADMPRADLADETSAAATDVDTPGDLIALHAERVHAVREGYPPPELSEPTYAQDGVDVPYGERWPDRSPPDDSYSVVSHPERFAPLREIVDALVVHLSGRYDVEVTVGDELAEVLEHPPDEVVRAVRLVPSRDQCAALTFVITSQSGVWLHAGALYEEPFPSCGCDACDESLLGTVDELTEPVFDVVAGGFAESITDHSPGWPGRTVDVAHVFPTRSGTSHGAVMSPHAAERAARLIPDGHRVWQPWPRR